MNSQSVAQKTDTGSSTESLKVAKSAFPARPKSLREVMAQKKREMSAKSTEAALASQLVDPYEICDRFLPTSRLQTAFIYDPRFSLHFNTWDENHPERPGRSECIYARGEQLKLWDTCFRLTIDPNIDDEIIKNVHSQQTIDRLKTICQKDEPDMEIDASAFDSVYFNKSTYETAKISATAVLQVTRAVAKGEFKNGFALVRPPGHHAMHNEFNGYCFFNNVAIAAEQMIKEGLAKKILIVDYDVHHGQGVQRAFYDRDDVLYFSIHRYEHGTFWPNLEESNFDYIGKGKGKGFNVNVPINQTGLGDAEYLAIILNILLPIAYEFCPDLVLICAGYDAAIGCPEGEMMVSPAFYGHLVTLLGGIALGKIVVCLEGGYFLPSLAEGAVMTVKALLGQPCGYIPPFSNVHPVVVDVINNLKYVLKPYWSCFSNVRTFEYPKGAVTFEESLKVEENEHLVVVKYCGTPLTAPFLTRTCYPVVNNLNKEFNARLIETLRLRYESINPFVVGYVYEESFKEHVPVDVSIPECPERLLEVMKVMKENKIDERCKRIEISKHEDVSEICQVHEANYVNNLQFNKEMEVKPDVYKNENTFKCILNCVNGVLSLIDAIVDRKICSGVAIIRPPGHHAEYDRYGGFCLINNVAVAANYLTTKYDMRRVLIIDFDVHHGNGTQKLTYDRKDVMLISVHRYDHGKFYPHGAEGDYNYSGEGAGEGFNINIPFNNDKMGDSEYLRIFQTVILPLAYSYSPEFVLISAGFDAGINDRLGHYNVSPEMFGHFVQLLKPLAEGKVIVCLEGGYNLKTVSYSLNMCTKALLDDPLPIPQLKENFVSVTETLRDVIKSHKKFWPILNIDKTIARGIYSPQVLWKIRDVEKKVSLKGNQIEMKEMCDDLLEEVKKH